MHIIRDYTNFIYMKKNVCCFFYRIRMDTGSRMRTLVTHPQDNRNQKRTGKNGIPQYDIEIYHFYHSSKGALSLR